MYLGVVRQIAFFVFLLKDRKSGERGEGDRWKGRREEDSIDDVLKITVYRQRQSKVHTHVEDDNAKRYSVRMDQ